MGQPDAGRHHAHVAHESPVSPDETSRTRTSESDGNGTDSGPQEGRMLSVEGRRMKDRGDLKNIARPNKSYNELFRKPIELSGIGRRQRKLIIGADDLRLRRDNCRPVPRSEVGAALQAIACRSHRPGYSQVRP